MRADVLSPSSRSVAGTSCSAGYWSRETANRHAGSNHPAVVERYTSLAPRRQTTDTGLGECDGTRASSRVQDTHRFRGKFRLVNRQPSPRSFAVGMGPKMSVLGKLSLTLRLLARIRQAPSTRARERNMFDERRDFKVSSHPGFSTKPKILIPARGLCRPALHNSTPQAWQIFGSISPHGGPAWACSQRSPIDRKLMGSWADRW